MRGQTCEPQVCVSCIKSKDNGAPWTPSILTRRSCERILPPVRTHINSPVLSVMGVVTSVVTAVTGLIGTVLGLIDGIRASSAAGRIGPNPVLRELQERARRQQEQAEQADRARRRAEEELAWAREQQRAAQARAAEQTQRAADERARAEEAMRRAQEEAERADELRRRIEEETWRTEEQCSQADEARQTAEAARTRAEQRARRLRKDKLHADESRKKAEENANRAEEETRKAEEQRRRADEERKCSDQAKGAAEEQCRRAEEARVRSEAERARADAEARKAMLERQRAQAAEAQARKAMEEAEAARKEAEKALREGIKPIIIPTAQEFEATKRRLQYREGMFHFAIAGVAGSGKSSLINAFRGLRNSDRSPLVARTGVVETTNKITRFADPNPANPFVWYDIPGAGTLNVPDWVYFNEQGLYAFDCIIVLTDNRFMQTDEAILRNCARFNIPAYIVRSKSRQHIQNVLNDMPYDEDEGVDDAVRMEKARRAYMRETRDSIARNLGHANLPHQRVYMVDKEYLVQVSQGKHPKDVLDEWDLLKDLLSEASARRVRMVLR